MVHYDLRDNIAYLSIDNGKANAIGYEQIEAIIAGLDKAQEEAVAVVLTGTEGMFCAGFDLQVIKQGDEAMQELFAAGAQMVQKLQHHPQPVVAACSGHAVALGAILLMVCDYRLGIDGDFKLGLNETAVGLPFPRLAYQLIRSCIPLNMQRQLVLLGDLYSPQQAQTLGLLDAVVKADTLTARAHQLAQQMGSYPSTNFAVNKRHFLAEMQ